MTYEGRIKNGVIVLDENSSLPEGTLVRVEAIVQRDLSERLGDMIERAPSPPPGGERKLLWQRIVELGASVPDEAWAKVPEDLSINLDHYLYGSPKAEE